MCVKNDIFKKKYISLHSGSSMLTTTTFIVCENESLYTIQIFVHTHYYRMYIEWYIVYKDLNK